MVTTTDRVEAKRLTIQLERAVVAQAYLRTLMAKGADSIAGLRRDLRALARRPRPR